MGYPARIACLYGGPDVLEAGVCPDPGIVSIALQSCPCPSHALAVQFDAAQRPFDRATQSGQSRGARDQELDISARQLQDPVIGTADSPVRHEVAPECG
jgi:hypothetical protein